MKALSPYSRRDFLQLLTLPFFLTPAGLPGQELKKLRDLLNGSTPLTWVFTGDSVTQGAHHTYGGRAYPETVAERIRWELRRINDLVINSGVNGTNTQYLLGNYEWFVSRFRPSVVSVMYGINDCVEPSISLAIFQENLTDIVRKIRTQKAIPILQTPNAIDREGMKTMKSASREKLPLYVQVIKQVAKDESCILVNHFDDWQNSNHPAYLKWLDDPLHPNTEGHTQLARLFFKTIDVFDPNAFTCAGQNRT